MTPSETDAALPRFTAAALGEARAMLRTPVSRLRRAFEDEPA